VSSLRIIVPPEVAAGFHLAAAEAFSAENSAQAERLVRGWIAAGESGLLAIDEGLLAGIEPGLRRQLEDGDPLPCLPIPRGDPQGEPAQTRARLVERIRRVVGVHIVFRGHKP
jgi:vacuolar-type H+-ATPase subunit F/Vma7